MKSRGVGGRSSVSVRVRDERERKLFRSGLSVLAVSNFQTSTVSAGEHDNTSTTMNENYNKIPCD